MINPAAKLPNTIEIYRQWAVERINSMSDMPPAYCKEAYTSRRTEHVIFVNGHRAIEGGDVCSPYDPGDMAENLVSSVREYRNMVAAPRLLVWRCEPKFSLDEDGEWKLYARLCFETGPEI